MELEKIHPFFIALDTSDWEKFTFLVDTLKDTGCGFKVGMEAFYSLGERACDYIKNLDLTLFLDLKLHDIPNTTSKGILNLAKRFEPEFINVHASGGLAMLSLVQKDCPSKLLGVSVLTSFSEKEIQTTFKTESSLENLVLNFVSICDEAKLSGVVCSGHESLMIKEKFPRLVTMVPGIRLSDGETHDQKRIMTPYLAKQNKADFLVIGRGITESHNILKTFEKYWENYNENY